MLVTLSRPVGSTSIGPPKAMPRANELRTDMSNSQTPMEEAAERLAEGMPGLGIAAKAVGLQDHQRMLDSAQDRLDDGHDAMRQAAGLKPREGKSAGEKMGDITISGDSVNHNYYQPSPAPTNKPPEPAPRKPMGNLTKAALAAALASAIGAGGYLLGNQGEPDVAPPSVEAPVHPDTTRKVEVEKWIPGTE